MKVVIIAGGKGTRIASLNSEIPKAMIPINGKPVLEYQIELAKRYGHTDIFLVIGYLGDKIRSYFGNGESFGVQIKYFEEHSPLGTGGIEECLDRGFFSILWRYCNGCCIR